MSHLDEQINRMLAGQVGMNIDEVAFLRKEFVKYGRNPLVASVEILAIENGFDEERVKQLLDLHLKQLRKMDGLAEQIKAVYD